MVKVSNNDFGQIVSILTKIEGNPKSVHEVLEELGYDSDNVDQEFFTNIDTIIWKCNHCEFYKRAYEFGFLNTSSLDEHSICTECEPL